MIYLLRKHDIISVPSYDEGIYHPPKVDIISKIYHPFRKERISLKKATFVGRQKWLFSCVRVTKRSKIEVRVSKSSMDQFDKLEFGGQWPLTMRTRCSVIRYCPDPLGIVTAEQLDKLEFVELSLRCFWNIN